MMNIICAKLLQIPLMDEKVMYRNIPSNNVDIWSPSLILTFGRLSVVPDTSADYGEYLCKVISNSPDGWKSYGSGMKYTVRHVDF